VTSPARNDEPLLRVLVISLSCLALGLGLIVGASFLDEGSLPRDVIQEFATILMISGGVGVVLDVFTRRSLLAGVEASLGTLLGDIRNRLDRVSDATNRVADNTELGRKATTSP
jgi:hypothetical protein